MGVLQRVGYDAYEGHFSRVLEAGVLVAIVVSLVIVAASTGSEQE